MKTTDPRDMTWQEIRGNLAGTRELIHQWMLTNGPATTSEIAEAVRVGLLTVRPRVSELCAWGFAECDGRKGLEGVYRARTIEEAQRLHEESREAAQLNFGI